MEDIGCVQHEVLLQVALFKSAKTTKLLILLMSLNMLDSYNPVMVNCLHGHGMIQSVNFILWLTGPLLHLWRLMMGIQRASSSYFMQEDHLRFAFVWLYKAGHVLGAAMLILLVSKRFTLEAIPMKKIIIFVLLKSLHNSLKPSKSQLLITSLALNKPRVDVLLEKTHDESYHFLVQSI